MLKVTMAALSVAAVVAGGACAAPMLLTINGDFNDDAVWYRWQVHIRYDSDLGVVTFDPSDEYGRPRATLALLGAIAALAWPNALGQVAIIAAAGFVGWRWLRADPPAPGAPVHVPIGRSLALASRMRGCDGMLHGDSVGLYAEARSARRRSSAIWCRLRIVCIQACPPRSEH